MRSFPRALLCGALVAASGAALLPGPSADAQPATWNFEQAAVPAAQPLGSFGKGILVAVVDTWVDPNQAQFGGRVVDEADCLPGSCQDHKYAPDSCVHGTHVAGTIASADYGVAPEADILAVQVLSGAPGAPNPSASCSGSASVVASGINFAVARGARVINLSVGDSVPGVFQSAAISAAVANAAHHNAVVVFAAGNQGVPLTDSYGNDALIVAATGPSGQLAGYSNFNTPLTGDVNVAAPGGDTGTGGSCTTADCILSTYPGGKVGLLEGTSMAAPHVSGLAALLLAQDPGRSTAKVFSAIEDTARPLPGAGSGLIDAAKALQVEAGSHPVSSATTPVGAPAPTPTSKSPAGSPPGSTPGSAGVSSGSTAGQAHPGIVPVPVLAPFSATTSSTRPPATVPSPLFGTAGGATASRVGAPAVSGHETSGPTGSGWMGRHAGILALACLLLAGDIVAVLWWRRRGPRFGLRT